MLASLNLRLSDNFLRDRMVPTAGAEGLIDTEARTLGRWMFWIDGGVHALFLVVALIAIFRS
jgi:hypothetical protein